MATSQDSLQDGAMSQTQGALRDPVLWGFLVALVVFFWTPELIIYMEWADFWIIFLTEAFIWSLFAVAFNLLMGYGGLISFGQAAYLGIGDVFGADLRDHPEFRRAVTAALAALLTDGAAATA